MNDNSKTAYPSNEKEFFDEVLIGETTEKGMTLRERYAGLAMQGLLSKYTLNNPEDQAIVAQLSVEMADSLIESLKID